MYIKATPDIPISLSKLYEAYSFDSVVFSVAPYKYGRRA